MNKIYLAIVILTFIVFVFFHHNNKRVMKMNNILKIVFQEGDPPSLNPHHNITHIRCMTLNKLLFEGLTRLDENQKTVFAGADSVDISDDKLKYVFKLRDCKYSDGTKITAYDYEAAWKAAILPNSLCIRCDLFYVIKNAKAIREGKIDINEFGAKALDEKTLEVQLEYPSMTFLKLITNPIFAPIKLNREEIKVFNGPFIVKDWHKSKNMTLCKNSMYWDLEDIKLDLIDIRFVHDRKTNYNLFQKNKIDWIGAPISSLSIEEIDILKKANILQKKLSTLVFWLHINTNLTHLKSKYIRKALSLSINRSLVNNNIINGKNPTSFLPDSMTCFEQSFDCNLKKAKEYFAKGLKELNISDDEFPEIILSSFTGPGMKELASFIKQSWESTLNIKVHLLEKDWNSFINSLESLQYEIGGFNETSISPDPLDLLELIEKKEGWESKEYQKILYDMKYATKEKQRKRLMQKALEILEEEEPIIVLSNRVQTFATNPKLKGYYFDYVNSIDFSRTYFAE